jgi:Zn-dependent M28 family amino/carboxypeptidase
MYRRPKPVGLLTGFSAASLAAVLALAAYGQPSAPLLAPPVRRAMEQVRPEAIRAHVRYLSDDLLEGRDTGRPGGILAARYIASKFEALGLKPIGDNGTYYQNVPFVESRRDVPASRLSLLDGEPVALEGGKDFLPGFDAARAVKLEAPVVFAGYGITAPEYQYDDYKELNVTGKVVVLLAGEPPSKDPAVFDGDKDTRHASAVAKVSLARSKGAAAVISVRPGVQDLAAWDRFGRALGSPRLVLPAPGAADAPSLTLQPQAAERLFQGAPTSWKDVEKAHAAGTVKPFALPRRARLELAVQETPRPAPNVVGLLEGSDPELKKQVVIYTAHYDHVGRQPAGEGDTIFNGAWDNASGTSEVLEIARAFTALEHRPRRSVLFMLVTGEEKGLLGSRYYTSHPLIPIEDTAANLNLDMTEIFGIPKEIVAQGAERSSLQRAVEAVSRELGLKIGADPTPQLGVFTRSDQFSFAQVGVPCVFMRWANEHEDVDPAAAKANSEDKLRRIYHKPGDEFDPTWSWEGMRRHAQHSFLIGLHVANDPEMPRWNPGDPFDKPRGKRTN